MNIKPALDVLQEVSENEEQLSRKNTIEYLSPTKSYNNQNKFNTASLNSNFTHESDTNNIVKVSNMNLCSLLET